MTKIETYSDAEGNSISIKTDLEGVNISAQIRTKPPYTGGSNSAAAKSYAQKHDLLKS